MAFSSSPNSHYFFFLSFLLLQNYFLYSCHATFPQPNQNVKSLHFTLFEHDFLNKTTFTLVNGVAGAEFTSTTSPIGTITVFEDPMTVTPSPTSKQIAGKSEGIFITSSLDGLRTIAIVKVTLNINNKYKGTVSILGGSDNVKPADAPVVGGTGDFLFVQGYITTSSYSSTPLIYTYKWDFHLYWPPYIAPKDF